MELKLRNTAPFKHCAIFLTGFLFLFSGNVFVEAQQIDYRPGDILLQVKKGYDIHQIARMHVEFEGEPTQINIAEVLSSHSGIYRITFDYGRIHQSRFLASIQQNPYVEVAQINRRIRNRNIPPNDPLFSDQWHLLNTGQSNGTPGADISAIEAWSITTGGVTALGDTIVVAVIDNGINIEHPDLQGLIWKNRDEIEGTGMDDDGNGYIDDVYGWNTFQMNGIVTGGFLGSHGTPVSGMIGALTNNVEGIAGTNWDIKIMSVVGGDGFESNAIASYEYVLTQRRIYNETMGERGAFVVVTNSSWGIDGGNPDDSPLWCSFYDTLGAHGILSVAATTNFNQDVDIIGDLPTSCSSDFLISVTATNRSDQRANTGFGRNTIDLGAPGAGVMTTRNNGGYGVSTGTSFASPLVAGVVGLMYSAPCESLIRIGQSHPETAALMVKQLLLESTDSVSSLEGETITGGRLNAAKAIDNLLYACADCPKPLNIVAEGQDELRLTLSWLEVVGTESVDLRVRKDSGQWNLIQNVTPPYLLNLELCSNYDIEIRAICEEEEGEWTPVANFKSIGCCVAPSEFEISFEDPTTATISWDEIIPAFEYNIRFRAYGDDHWDITDLWEPNHITFDGLEPCHIYEFQVQARCNTGFTAFSNVMILETPACLDCNAIPFCEPDNVEEIDANFEWIDSFVVAGEAFPLPGRGVGFAESVSDLVSIINMGEELSIRLKPQYINLQFPEYFRIWIDFNRDGIFATDELIFDPGRTVTEAIDTAIVIPINAGIAPGHVRMRVSMQFMEDPDSIPPANPCAAIEFGQVIDYCVLLYQPFIECPEIVEATAEVVSPTGIRVEWDAVENAIAYNLRYRELNDTEWAEEDATPDTFYQISELRPCTPYEIQVRRICTFDTSAYTVSFVLFTKCPNSVIDPSEDNPLQVNAYPNPFGSELFLTVELPGQYSGDYSLRIFDLNGRLISNRTYNLAGGGETTLVIDQLSNSPPGMYIIEITDGVRRKVKKVVKQE